MERRLALLLRCLLVAAFVPILFAALEAGSRLVLQGDRRILAGPLVAFVVMAALAWVSLRLSRTNHWKILGLGLATVACVAIWSMVFLSFGSDKAAFVP